ncbi:hypothetical protein BTUL_0110g00450 [Botrytis tulipae]|uniref:Uncharacterized protein n=1 Tax=Botrytis tulipae TaxID=87230 RepID=A0A4Z1EG51_9HELO|nr:hypothetical protein BTUL_0110g00450 [Botrytis tulipae]
MPDHNKIETLCREAALGLKEHHSKFWMQKENYKIVELECRKCRLQIRRIKSKQAKEAAEEQAREAKVQADRARANAAYQANRQNRRIGQGYIEGSKRPVRYLISEGIKSVNGGLVESLDIMSMDFLVRIGLWKGLFDSSSSA